jgi:hypothetical protein
MLILRFILSTKASRSIFKIETKIKITVCFCGDHPDKYSITLQVSKNINGYFTTSKILFAMQTPRLTSFLLVATPTPTAGICVIHPDLPALEFLSVNGFHHFIGRSGFDLNPAIHFLHVDPSQYFFLKVAHIQDKLQEACLIKTVFCTQVDKKPLK